MENNNWPALNYEDWKDTYDTLHLYTQVAGKIKLELSPFFNEWWHTALAIWARGLTTGPIPFGNRIFEIRFDFVSHNVEIFDSIGNMKTIALEPRTVSEFCRLVIASLGEMGIEVAIALAPQEMQDSIPIETDTIHNSYDAESVSRFWTILASLECIFEEFRSGFSGKSSPVQFWWGSFDVAVSRYCGRPCSAPPKANRMSRVGCDEEHFAAGFWPGDDKLKQPAFYAYGYPSAPGIESATIMPKEAYWNADMGEFILHYEDVRKSSSPEKTIADFLTSTYEAIANLGHWDREFLERKIE